MKTNELRIGNFILYKKKTERIAMISDIDCCIFESENFSEYIDFKDVSPIPLTEDWLKKFGFKSVEYPEGTIDEREKYKENAGKHWFWRIPDCPINLRIKEGMKLLILESINLEHIKYVHQLQNLYFALTEKELTLKQ